MSKFAEVLSDFKGSFHKSRPTLKIPRQVVQYQEGAKMLLTGACQDGRVISGLNIHPSHENGMEKLNYHGIFCFMSLKILLAKQHSRRPKLCKTHVATSETITRETCCTNTSVHKSRPPLTSRKVFPSRPRLNLETLIII